MRSCSAVENRSVSMTYHRADGKCTAITALRAETSRKSAPTALRVTSRQFASGTEQVQQYLPAGFPQAAIGRMDADTTPHKNAHRNILRRFAAGQTDILIGTQMIAKGLDFQRHPLWGVLSADLSLNRHIRASERTFQLLTQVSRPSGRGDLPR